MSKHGLWTVIVPSKKITKKTEDFSIENPCPETINDDAFWNQSKFNNVNVIQFTDDNIDNDQVEYTDDRSNGSYDEAVFGNFRTEFINRFDAAHLISIQEQWDVNERPEMRDSENNALPAETEAEKIARLGPRPTSYTST